MVMVDLGTAIRIEVGEIVFGYLGRAAGGVGGEGGIAARRPPAGHGKDEDEKGPEDCKDCSDGSVI